MINRTSLIEDLKTERQRQLDKKKPNHEKAQLLKKTRIKQIS